MNLIQWSYYTLNSNCSTVKSHILKQMKGTQLVHFWTASKQEAICEIEILLQIRYVVSFPFSL